METTTLTFGAPLWLFGFFALPLLIVLYGLSHYRGRTLISKVVAPRLREQLVGSVSMPRRIVRALLVLMTFAFILLALAQPRYGFIQQEIKQKGRDVVIAVDTSRSMLATDVAPNRLTRAKLLTQDFMRLLKGDRVGLVAFAGSAFLQAPLTLDYSAVTNALDELDTTVIPKGGTNIAAAITIAEQAFGKAEGQTRALLILTDGEELDADSIAAAKKAASQGIRIFTVGIGSPDGSLIPIRTEQGRQDFVRDRAGKPVQSRLDSGRLQEIATATGGFYTPLGPDAAREIFQKGIEPMDLTESGVFASRQPLERYQWPLSLAVGLLIFWLLLGERRRMRIGKGRPALAAAILLLSFTNGTLAASTGLEDYQSGKFDKALQLFEKRLKSKPNSHELQFNAGASAYKLGDYPQAVSYFTNALLAEDIKLREEAYYNLANSLVRRGEAAKENQVKKADWKNAIEHYTEALNLEPKNKKAEENREIVKKLLEELEKKEKQEQEKKDQQKQEQEQKKEDKKDQQQDKKEDQNKDQKDQEQKEKEKQDQQKQDQQGGDQKDKQDQKNSENQTDKKEGDEKQENKDSQSKEGNKQQEEKDKQASSKSQGEDKNNGKDQQPAAVPTPTPGEKKQGDLKANSETDQKPDEKPKQGEAVPAAGEEEREGEMSAAQARGLLNSLRSEEEKVNLMQQQTSQEVTRDW